VEDGIDVGIVEAPLCSSVPLQAIPDQGAFFSGVKGVQSNRFVERNGLRQKVGKCQKKV